GYLVATADGTRVVELVAGDLPTAIAMARSWVTHRDPLVRFNLPVAEYELTRALIAVGESRSLGHSGNWQIFDWKRTVQVLMSVRGLREPLADGQVSIAIEGYGGLRIRVSGGAVEVVRIGVDSPTWHPYTAMRVLFGPLAPAQVTELSAASAALSAWCPLPLDWPRQDGV
ncbi:uncharacterized protein METZ01_LOCUS389355, partial [marine metagenome]